MHDNLTYFIFLFETRIKTLEFLCEIGHKKKLAQIRATMKQDCTIFRVIEQPNPRPSALSRLLSHHDSTSHRPPTIPTKQKKKKRIDLP